MVSYYILNNQHLDETLGDVTKTMGFDALGMSRAGSAPCYRKFLWWKSVIY